MGRSSGITRAEVTDVEIYRNDLEPPLQVDCTRVVDVSTKATEPVDLSEIISARVMLTGVGNQVIIDRTVPLTSEQKSAGLVEMPWEVGDTATVGTLKVEVEVMWPGNRPQTFRPKDGVKILADRG